MKYLILDTSSIIFGLSNKINVFDSVNNQLPGYRILISKGVERELEKMGKGRSKYGKYAKVAIHLLKASSNIDRAEDTRFVDAWILKDSVALKAAVCTNDTKLKKALRAKGITAYSISRSGILK